MVVAMVMPKPLSFGQAMGLLASFSHVAGPEVGISQENSNMAS